MLQFSVFRNRSHHLHLSYTVAICREHEWLSPRATALQGYASNSGVAKRFNLFIFHFHTCISETRWKNLQGGFKQTDISQKCSLSLTVYEPRGAQIHFPLVAQQTGQEVSCQLALSE